MNFFSALRLGLAGLGPLDPGRFWNQWSLPPDSLRLIRCFLGLPSVSPLAPSNPSAPPAPPIPALAPAPSESGTTWAPAASWASVVSVAASQERAEVWSGVVQELELLQQPQPYRPPPQQLSDLCVLYSESMCP